MNKQRWKKLMSMLSLGDNLSTYHCLLAAYCEKHRHYHTETHISACLKWLDAVVSLADNVNEIELSLWFHDVIYKPYSSNNELDSANLAIDFLHKNMVSDEIAQTVHALIMSTQHRMPTQTKDQSLLVDIDLTILGSDSITYRKFEENIRKEYKWVPYFIYRKKRIELLQSILNKGSVYQNEYFQQKLETQARKNLKQAILSL